MPTKNHERAEHDHPRIHHVAPLVSRGTAYAALVASCWLLAATAGCDRRGEISPPPPEPLALDAPWPKMLSELGIYAGELKELNPAPGMVPYELNSPGYFDDARAERIIRLPRDKLAQYKPDDSLDFPPGTLVAQTLYFPHDERDPSAGRRITETRLMVKETKGWVAAPYVWNPEQTDAKLTYIGKRIPLSWTGRDGKTQAYDLPVPDANGCKRCHKVTGRFTPIGLSPRQLNRPIPAALKSGDGAANQLAWWKDHGLLKDLPSQPPQLADWRQSASGSVEERARAWLEVNCAHCHNPLGAARNSGLQLGANVKHPPLYGVYKTPVAAGRGSGTFAFDIVPGQPDQSILVYRISSTQAGVVMPEFGRGRVDHDGVALVKEWIAGMSSSEAGADIVGDVRELAPEQMQDWLAQAAEKGDAARGERVFLRRDLSCVKCHALGGVGGHVGPDLLTRPQPLQPAEIVESILLPAKSVKEGYATVTVNLDDGRSISGIKVREDAKTLVLRDPVRGDTVIDVGSIEDRADGGTLMPTGVVARLPKGEFLDLVRFLSEMKPPPTLTDGAHVVRRWEVISTSLAQVIGPITDAALQRLFKQAELPWETCFSQLDGLLPLDALTSDPEAHVVWLRTAFELREPTDLNVHWDGASPQGWIIGSAVLPAGQGPVAVAAGRHELWLHLDRRQVSSGTLRCTIAQPTDKPDALRLLGDDAATPAAP